MEGRPPRVRVGTDIQRVAAVADSIHCFGDRYLQRVYTPGEIACCGGGRADAARRLAARFAAKEACLKVLRPAQPGLDWRSIEVVRQPGGWCELALHGVAQELARREGIRHLSVSLSHEDDYALAVVAATLAD